MKLFNRLSQWNEKRKDLKTFIEHEFVDHGHVNNHGYNISVTLRLKLYIPKFYTEAEDDIEYMKKNIRRWNRYVPKSDLVSFVDAYLENYTIGNYGYILNPDKHMPTEEYIEQNFEILSKKEQYIGCLKYTVIKLSKYHTIYITRLANDISYVVNVCNLNLDIKKSEIRRLLEIDFDYYDFEK